MAYDPIRLDADRAALHLQLRTAENAVAEAHAMSKRLGAHLDELCEDNRRLTAERGQLLEQLQRQSVT